MLTYFSILLLGAAGRASELVLDADARLVMPDHWRLDWTTPRRGGHSVQGASGWMLG